MNCKANACAFAQAPAALPCIDPENAMSRSITMRSRIEIAAPSVFFEHSFGKIEQVRKMI
jgi:hypothetical protein